MAIRESETALEEQWERISGFIEKLAEENEKAEEKLYKRAKTEEKYYHIDELNVTNEKNDANLSAPRERESFKTFNSEINKMRSSFSGIHNKYDDVKNDLNLLLDDLREFKTNRNQLESTLYPKM